VPRRPTPAERPTPYVVPTPREETELVQACLDGRAEAWRRLLDRYDAVIHAIPRRFGLDADDAAEVYQNVCLALLRGLPRLRAAAGLTRWVLVTTRRQARDLARKRRREAPTGDETLMARVPDRGPTAAALLEELSDRVALRAAVEKLPPRCRDLLAALYLDPEPLAYKEIARKFGIPEGTIGPTRMRCLARLKRLVENSRPERTK
jgi:RNA polymerase sigma factor (sigma-70 family)